MWDPGFLDQQESFVQLYKGERSGGKERGKGRAVGERREKGMEEENRAGHAPLS